MDVRKRLGAKVRSLRLERGLSQEAFAYECGVSQQYISGLERGMRNPTLMMLCDIAAALSVNVADLLGNV